ncbi:MAG: methyl-accepting chemotaxis protein [Spirochaeta sp.]|jgi:methyl-accepting chemotaxis protein|nr:methyl-accepting chemotaxis protein [Spirochaeta sp.]
MKSQKKQKSIVGSLSVASTVPMVLLLLISGTVTLFVLGSNIDRLVEQNAVHTMDLMEEIVSTEVDGAVSNYLRAIAEKNRDLMELFYQRYRSGELSEEEAYAAVSAIFLDPEYGRIGTTGYLAGVSTDGVLVIHPRSPGVDASGAEFMQEAMALRNGYLEYEWQNVDEDKPRMKAGYLSYFEPWDVMVWASSYKSEFFALIDVEALNATVNGLSVGTAGYVVILDSQGRTVAGADHAGVIADGTPRTGQVETGNGLVYAGARQYDELDWSIVVVSPMERYTRILTVFRWIVVLAVVLAAGLLHLFIRLLMKRRLKPITEMQNLAGSVAAGDLTQRVIATSHDEIGDVAHSFNGIVAEFASLIGKMKEVIMVLSSSIQNLSTSAQEIASTSNEQAAAVKEVLSTMEDVDQTSKDILVKVEEVARIAGHTTRNVEKGFDLIKVSLEKMAEIRNTNSDTISGIKTLGERFESIWEIVNIINGIADQTKIIAFNAELEAAAAGDAGKNFQIVAGEIRRLADGTVNSTNEIKGKINEIQHASDKLIVASEDGTQKISEGWNVSTEIRTVFEDVLQSSEISATSAEEITRSTKMQVSSFEQIFTTLKQISEAIDSFVESTNYTNEVSDQLTGITESFDAQVSVYTVAGRKDDPSGSAEQGKNDGK